MQRHILQLGQMHNGNIYRIWNESDTEKARQLAPKIWDQHLNNSRDRS